MHYDCQKCYTGKCWRLSNYTVLTIHSHQNYNPVCLDAYRNKHRRFNSLFSLALDHKRQCSITEITPPWTKLILISPRNTSSATASDVTIALHAGLSDSSVTSQHLWHSNDFKNGSRRLPEDNVCHPLLRPPAGSTPVTVYTDRVVAPSASLGLLSPETMCIAQATLAECHFHTNMAFACSSGYSRNTLHYTLYPNILVVLCDSWQSPGFFFFLMFQLPYRPLKAPINTNINVLIMHTPLRCRITYFYYSSALYRVQ